jgi:hypothetical protein
MLFRRSGRDRATESDGNSSTPNSTVAYDSDFKYVGEVGGNDAPEMFQEAGGAPVESHSPLGYNVGPVTILFLNISMMIGTGIYSTRKY